MDLLTRNYNETVTFGQKVGQCLKPNDIVLLFGDLGAGKTALTKGICRGLGITKHEYIRSPTFTLINNYEASLDVMHVDFYREPNINRWVELGFRELIYNSGLVLIEWADLIPDLIPSEAMMIKFEHINENERKIYTL